MLSHRVTRAIRLVVVRAKREDTVSVVMGV